MCVRQGFNRCDQPQGFSKVLRLSRGLQPGQLQVPHVRLGVQEKGIYYGVSTERLLGGDPETATERTLAHPVAAPAASARR